MDQILELVCEAFPESDFKTFTGFDDAVIGEWNMRICYSARKIVDQIIKNGSDNEEPTTREEAMDDFYFNFLPSCYSHKGPIIVDDLYGY